MHAPVGGEAQSLTIAMTMPATTNTTISTCMTTQNGDTPAQSGSPDFMNVTSVISRILKSSHSDQFSM